MARSGDAWHRSARRGVARNGPAAQGKVLVFGEALAISFAIDHGAQIHETRLKARDHLFGVSRVPNGFYECRLGGCWRLWQVGIADALARVDEEFFADLLRVVDEAAAILGREPIYVTLCGLLSPSKRAPKQNTQIPSGPTRERLLGPLDAR